MTPRPHLLVALLLVPALAGCAQGPDGGGVDPLALLGRPSEGGVG